MKQESPIRWDVKGVPHSTTFHDKYFCTQNGYEECLYVSDQGNCFSERFAKLDPLKEGVFTIIETGFGTGLSFCCTWQLWNKFAPKSWKLHFISIELYPMSNADVARALSIWPALSEYKEKLCQEYEPASAGVKDFAVDGKHVKLTILFDDVILALKTIKDQRIAGEGADAWLLNGFSPFSNPLMWSVDVFKGMSRVSKIGATLSTFTVASAVRRGLEGEGFAVERIKGYGTKKQVLKGVFVGKKI